MSPIAINGNEHRRQVYWPGYALVFIDIYSLFLSSGLEHSL